MTNREQRAAERLTNAVLSFFTGILIFTGLGSAQAESDEGRIDFSNYDVPLYEQITNRIKAKVLARLGEGKNSRDRYFIIPFAYENRGNDPEFSHSFISVIRVLADSRQQRLTPGLKVRTDADREFEAFTISWLPDDFLENPRLRVFEGFGARLFPQCNRCPMSPGKNFSLAETAKLAVGAKVAVAMWGPYEITREGFDLGVRRMRLLDAKTIKYRADDRIHRKRQWAINCFHAMAGLDKLFPNGGLFGTGFKMWGVNGTTRVLIEYTTKANYKGLLLEPVNAKKDRFGFVYAARQSPRGVYNPFQKASAYRMMDADRIASTCPQGKFTEPRLANMRVRSGSNSGFATSQDQPVADMLQNTAETRIRSPRQGAARGRMTDS